LPKLAQAEPISLEDFAALAASLNTRQIARLTRQLKGVRDVPLYYLRLYGSLTRGQREALLEGETLALSGLSPEQRRLTLRQAQITHPWFSEADLAHATLRVLHQTLCTEEPGIALILEYHRPESPRDRDICFSFPLHYRPTTEAAAGSAGVSPAIWGRGRVAAGTAALAEGHRVTARDVLLEAVRDKAEPPRRTSLARSASDW